MVVNQKKLGITTTNLMGTFSDCDPYSPHLSINQEFEFPIEGAAADDINEDYHTFSK